MTDDNNLTWHGHEVDRAKRSKQKNQQPVLLWFTGLSGAGKSTLANALDNALFKRNLHTYLLDGDNVRHGLNKDLSFSDTDRVENIRRIGETSKLLIDAGLIVVSAFISPFRSDRQMVRQLFAPGEFIEVYIATPLDVCESRDPKGLYKKARQGVIKRFTGIDSPYEEPEDPEVVLTPHVNSVEECVQQLLDHLDSKSILVNKSDD